MHSTLQAGIPWTLTTEAERAAVLRQKLSPTVPRPSIRKTGVAIQPRTIRERGG
jgi:hypothetical protein